MRPRRDFMIIIVLCAVTAFAVLGCIAAGYAITRHQPPAVVTRSVTRTVTRPPEIVIRYRVKATDRECAREAMAAYLGALQFSFTTGKAADNADGFDPPLHFCAGFAAVAPYVPPAAARAASSASPALGGPCSADGHAGIWVRDTATRLVCDIDGPTG